MSAKLAKPRPSGASLYESEQKIYPREIKGRFASLSKLATLTLLGLYYGVPWLMWAEKGLRAGRRVEGVVSNADLLPTVLDLLGLGNRPWL